MRFHAHLGNTGFGQRLMSFSKEYRVWGGGVEQGCLGRRRGYVEVSGVSAGANRFRPYQETVYTRCGYFRRDGLQNG
jgi:hypothetical protein